MSNQNNLSKREETLLKSLVESFICDGQPVGSSKLSKIKSVNLSSATIRNVFTDLEEMGLIYSPHTSAGRIPTTKGFRLFIDTMVNFQPVNESILSKIKINNVKDVNQEELLKNTNEMLSNITQLAGVVYLPSKENLHIRQIDFVRVNKNKVLAILISSDNQVENKILNTSKDFSNSDLEKAANLLPEKDKKDFIAYVSSKTWLIGHCIFISKNKKLMNEFYCDLFSWLFECEKIFGFDSDSYDTKRIYSFLTERYMPFWFNKYAKTITWPWIFCDITKF